MPSPTFDHLIAQVKDTLRAAQADAALAQLIPLFQRSLTAAQLAHAHALLAHAYELQSRWDEAAQLLHPYEDRAHTAHLPATVQQLLCLRLASLRTETTFEAGALGQQLTLRLAKMQFFEGRDPARLIGA